MPLLNSVTLPPYKLHQSIDYVLEYGRLMLVFDESQFLLPTKFSKNTPPPRLNWIRTQIVLKGIPLVLVSTPQAFDRQLKAYVDKSGYVIEQFVGRIGLIKELPDQLSEDDLLNVAKLNFPDIHSDYLELIVNWALKAESFIRAIEDIACRARYLAKKQGRSAIEGADVDEAAGDVLPWTKATQKRVGSNEAKPLTGKKHQSADSIAPCKSPAIPVQRQIKPVAGTVQACGKGFGMLSNSNQLQEDEDLLGAEIEV